MSSSKKKQPPNKGFPPEMTRYLFSNSKGRPPLGSSEAEMKALMSMFVEIMGMSESSSSPPKNGVFMFGGSTDKWPPSAKAAAAAMYSSNAPWDLEYYEEDDDDDDDDSLPALYGKDDVDTEDAENATDSAKQPALSPAEWEEQEEAREQESTRARIKAAKRREKKHRKKEKLKQEAAAKAQEAMQKKLEKQVQSWQSRVVAACHCGDVVKLQGLLRDESSIVEPHHLEFLLPNCISQNEDACRRMLAEYIVKTSVDVAFGIRNDGRNAVHAACLVGDAYFLQLLLKESASTTFLNTRCQDSGWTPLHYAVVSACPNVVELLLQGGCDVQACTDETRTCRASDGKGISARTLAELILSGKREDEIETEGDALQQVMEQHVNNATERQRYLSILESIMQRLENVEKNGYTPLPESVNAEQSLKPASVSVSEEASKRRKKKKKKAQPKQHVDNSSADCEGAGAVAYVEQKEDPLVTALLGMGFTSEQIHAAAKACGGMERATADEMVMWILGGGEEAVPGSSNSSEPVPALNDDVKQATVRAGTPPQEPPVELNQQENMEAIKREQEEARAVAQRLAAKREEQRRRNREWNNRAQARQKEETERRALEEAQRLAQERAAAERPSSGDGAVLMGYNGDAMPMPFQGPGMQAPAADYQILQRPPQSGSVASTSATLSMQGRTGTYPVSGNHVNAAEYTGQEHADFEAMGPYMSSGNSVSSGGSGRQLKAAPDSMYAPPPPGFYSSGMSAASSNLSMKEGTSFDDSKSVGEIRATARAFVPTAFKPTPPPGIMPATTLPAPGLGPPAASSDFFAPPADRRVRSDVLRRNRLSSRLPGMEESSGLSIADPASSLLTAAGARIPLCFERPRSAAPLSPGLSATSSVTTGIAAVEEPSLPSGIAFGLDGPDTPSSLLDPLSVAPTSSNQGTTASDIWGSASLGPGPPMPSLSGFGEGALDREATARSNVVGNRGNNFSGWQQGAFSSGGGTLHGLGSIW